MSIDGFAIELFPFTQLSRKVVQNIHLSGGSLLGVSRGGPNISDIVDSMQVHKSNFFHWQLIPSFLLSVFVILLLI